MFEINTLHTTSGDQKIVIDDSDPDKRKEAGKHITKLVRLGYLVFVTTAAGETYRVRGYDADSNEWVVDNDTPSEQQKGVAKKASKKVTKKRSAKKKRVKAADTSSTVAAPIAGG